MSSFKRLGRLGACVAVALTLSGCLRPLYGPTASGSTVERELQAIAVEPIEGRLGHYVVDDLIFALNGTGSHPMPRYKLTVKLIERQSTPTTNTFIGQPDSGGFAVDAAYTLTTAIGNVFVTSGVVTELVTYDRTSQRITNVRAVRDAQSRDAKSIAEQIRTRLAIALKAL